MDRICLRRRSARRPDTDDRHLQRGYVVRRIAVVVVAVAIQSVGLAAHPPAAAAACAPGGGNRWYATATSGSGTNTGTKAIFKSWHSWSVPAPTGFSDEAVWTIHVGTNNGLEGGFFTGLGNNVAWTNGMMPYYTTDNGQNEFDYANHYLAADTTYTMAVQPAIGTNHAKVNVGPFVLDAGNYTVATPRLNYMQGEVNTDCAWMGGGTGEQFTLYYQPASMYPNNWSEWGWMNTDADSPYWRQNIDANDWKNGGFGTS
jgi:hypothetical protein